MSKVIPVAPVITDDPILRQARTDQLRSYIETSLADHYHDGWGNSHFSVHVSRRSDYDSVKIFVTQADLIPDVEAFTEKIGDELRNEGIHAFFYVRPWVQSVGEGAILP